MMTPRLTNYIPHTPTIKQHAFLLLDGMDALYGGAAGGGKSDALLMAALQYVDIPGYNALLIRDTYSNLTKPEGLLDRSTDWLIHTDAVWNEKQKAWLFPNNSTLSFGYLDGPKDHFNYQSAEYQYIGIDEIANIREEQARYMFSRLRKKNIEGYVKDIAHLFQDKYNQEELADYYQSYVNIPLRFRAASNPPTREQYARGEWVKNKYVNPQTRDKSTVFIPAWLKDNPYVEKESYIKSLYKLDPVTRAQLLDGDWNINVKGNFFQRAWFKIISQLPSKNDILRTVRRWDLAGTEKTETKEPAWTVGIRMLETRFDGWIIDSIVRERNTPLQIKKLVRQTADMDGKDVLISMEQEPGSAGVSVIEDYRLHVLPGFAFYEDKKTISKLSSAMAYASQAEAGNIKLLAKEWNETFLEEHELFPSGMFKDQVDASCGAFNFLSEGIVPRASWM